MMAVMLHRADRRSLVWGHMLWFTVGVGVTPLVVYLTSYHPAIVDFFAVTMVNPELEPGQRRQVLSRATPHGAQLPAHSSVCSAPPLKPLRCVCCRCSRRCS